MSREMSSIVGILNQRRGAAHRDRGFVHRAFQCDLCKQTWTGWKGGNANNSNCLRTKCANRQMRCLDTKGVNKCFRRWLRILDFKTVISMDEMSRGPASRRARGIPKVTSCNRIRSTSTAFLLDAHCYPPRLRAQVLLSSTN